MNLCFYPSPYLHYHFTLPRSPHLPLALTPPFTTCPLPQGITLHRPHTYLNHPIHSAHTLSLYNILSSTFTTLPPIFLRFTIPSFLQSIYLGFGCDALVLQRTNSMNIQACDANPSAGRQSVLALSRLFLHYVQVLLPRCRFPEHYVLAGGILRLTTHTCISGVYNLQM